MNQTTTKTREKKESRTISVRLNAKEHLDYLTKCKANGWTISRKLKDAILHIVNSTN
jgi:hypothetical protein